MGVSNAAIVLRDEAEIRAEWSYNERKPATQV